MSTRREQFRNNIFTTLNGTINNSVTTLVVTDGTIFPATGDFRILIDTELFLVTARSSHTLTVVRGQETSTAASHTDGAIVVLALSSGSLQRFGRDNDWGFDSSRPALARIMDGAGDTITSASFTAVNAGTSTVADQNGCITLRKPTQAASQDVTAYVKSAPSAPYSIIAGLRVCLPADDPAALPTAGVVFRESGTQKLYVIGIATEDGSPRVVVSKFTDASILSANIFTHPRTLNDVAWFKITDDNTNLKFYVSHDGINWIEVHSEARTTFMAGAPNQVGFFSNNFDNGFETVMSLVHWDQG